MRKRSWAELYLDVVGHAGGAVLAFVFSMGGFALLSLMGFRPEVVPFTIGAAVTAIAFEIAKYRRHQREKRERQEAFDRAMADLHRQAMQIYTRREAHAFDRGATQPRPDRPV